MSDLISRQAAIDAMVNELSYLPITTEKAYEIAEVLNDLPSADPEIIRCKDCRWWTKHDTTLQGKCKLHNLNPMPEWYCASGEVEE